MNQFYRAKEGPLVADYDIRMVALDLDGTVFNNQKEITPRTLAAIRAALERGVAVLPATRWWAHPMSFCPFPGWSGC